MVGDCLQLDETLPDRHPVVEFGKVREVAARTTRLSLIECGGEKGWLKRKHSLHELENDRLSTNEEAGAADEVEKLEANLDDRSANVFVDIVTHSPHEVRV